MFAFTSKANEEVIVERFGRYHKTVSQAGLHLKTPFDRVAMRLTKEEFQKPFAVQLKTSDDVFVTLDVGCSMHITDSKQFYYSSVTPATQASTLLGAGIKAEASALTLKEMSDSTAVNDAIMRALSPLQQKLRDDYGLEVVAAAQQALHIPGQAAHALGNYSILVREAREKAVAQAQDATVSAAAMKEGLQKDVQIKKPLVLKKPSA